jgi:hypothetical protein
MKAGEDIELVLRDFHLRGLPLRASQCSRVSSDSLAFL